MAENVSRNITEMERWQVIQQKRQGSQRKDSTKEGEGKTAREDRTRRIKTAEGPQGHKLWSLVTAKSCRKLLNLRAATLLLNTKDPD